MADLIQTTPDFLSVKPAVTPVYSWVSTKNKNTTTNKSFLMQENVDILADIVGRGKMPQPLQKILLHIKMNSYIAKELTMSKRNYFLSNSTLSLTKNLNKWGPER